MTEAPQNPASHPPVVASGPSVGRGLPVGPKSLVAAGGVVALVTVLAVALYGRHTPPPTTARVVAPPVTTALPAPSPEVPPPTRSPAPVPAEAPPRTVQLSIRVEPAEATVSLDGKILAGNPFQGELPADRHTHLVQVSAPGYASTERMVSLARDTRLDISLVANRARHTTRRRDNPRVAAQPTESRRVEPGMDLKRPAAAAPRRQIDEKDPYAP
jgi:hypothetical protein